MRREMKASGIAWVDAIPATWEVLRNKACFDCSKIIIGKKSENTQLLSLTTKGVKEKRIEDSTGKVPESYDTYQLVTPNDIVMCLFDLDVSAVFSGISSYQGMISPAYKILKCKHIIIPQYADYWFSFIFDGRKFKHYAKNLRYTLNYDEFAVLPIVIPPVDEQSKIASFLDSECGRIDDVIEKTQASIEEYKKLKQAIITQAVTKGIRTDCEKKDSGIDWIGTIPINWNVQRFKNLGTCRNGLTYSPKDICDKDAGTLVLRSSNIKNGKLVFDDCAYVNCMINESLKVKKGDILVCSRNGSAKLIGKNALISDEIDAAFGAFMMIYRCSSPRYMQYILNSDVFLFNLASFLTSTVNQLTVNNFNNIHFPYSPDRSEQKEIVNFLDEKRTAIDKLVEQKEQLIVELEKFKKTLIYEYVTGKKEVPA